MIVNTTFVVDNQIVEKWQKWIKTIFATSASRSGMNDIQVFKVVDAPSESEGALTFAVQLRATTEQCSIWINTTLPELLNKMGFIWGEKALHFTTKMEEVCL
ncbi:MAG: DUF4286 family protein [Muribaculum sp.]|nr:DUF4286 family protein [Muribaculaceae bacterium]MCM1081767.1 DUF4286 family protein [Muribaculum sp.]